MSTDADLPPTYSAYLEELQLLASSKPKRSPSAAIRQRRRRKTIMNMKYNQHPSQAERAAVEESLVSKL